MYKQQLEEIRADFSRDVEKEAKKQTERAIQQESMDFEKMRCEKRLLQEKYMALKEKYMKLKNDVRLVVERRNKSREGYTTTSETERSKTEWTESSDQNTSLRSTHSTNSVANAKPTTMMTMKTTTIEARPTNDKSQSLNETTEDSKSVAKGATSFHPVSGTINNTPSSKNATKFESDDTTTASETNANTMKRRKSLARKTSVNSKQQSAANTGNNTNNNNNLENPVENIRKQLEKLEHLGDQLPSNETAYTLRYPFQDKGIYTLYFG